MKLAVSAFLCSRNARWSKVSWRFSLLPCSQNAHTRKVLVRCAQSEETKPRSQGMGGNKGKEGPRHGKRRVPVEKRLSRQAWGGWV